MENDDILIHLIPYQNKDSKIIENNNNNSLQQLKVSQNTSLYAISHFIYRLSSNNNQLKTTVSLYAQYSDKYVEIPLSLSIYHFLLITGGKETCELRYNFKSKDESSDNIKQFPKTSFIIKQCTPLNANGININAEQIAVSDHNIEVQSNINRLQYPDTIFHPPSLLSDTSFTQSSFLGDLSFTNSIQFIHPGSISFSLAYQNLSTETNKNESEEIDNKEPRSISLKEDLEQILRK